MNQELVRKQVCACSSNVLDVQPKVVRSIVGEGCFSGLWQGACRATGGNERDHAIADLEIFVDCPGFPVAAEAGKLGMTIHRDRGGRGESDSGSRDNGLTAVSREGVESRCGGSHALHEMASVHRSEILSLARAVGLGVRGVFAVKLP